MNPYTPTSLVCGLILYTVDVPRRFELVAISIQCTVNYRPRDVPTLVGGGGWY